MRITWKLCDIGTISVAKQAGVQTVDFDCQMPSIQESKDRNDLRELIGRCCCRSPHLKRPYQPVRLHGQQHLLTNFVTTNTTVCRYLLDLNQNSRTGVNKREVYLDLIFVAGFPQEFDHPKRRIERPWSEIEVGTLKHRVTVCDRSNWVAILKFVKYAFHISRPAVDLKGKYRNMQKHGLI